MPLYRYKALSNGGKMAEGTIDAESLREAKLKLLSRKIQVIQMVPLSEKEKRVQLKKQEVLIFTRELGRLLQAGLPLFEALSALEEKYQGQKSHPLLLDLCDRIRGGEPFSTALSRHQNSFDLLYTAMIANAEKTGRLEPALEELADLLRRQLSIRKQIVSALLYPSLLLTFCMVVISSLLFFVIPSLKELFEGRDLHPFTRIVFACSDFACNSKGLLLFILALLVAVLAGAFWIPSWRRQIFIGALKLPFLKNLFAKVAWIRFCRASSSLLEGGIPLIASFSQARGVMRHPILEKIIVHAEEKLAEGEPLSKTLKGHVEIPPLVPRMLAIAEQSGKLSLSLRQMAQIYEDEMETTLSHFASMAQPVLLLLLGALVGFVLLSVLLPMTDISSFSN